MMFNYCTQFSHNLQSTLIVKICRSRRIQHVCACPNHNCRPLGPSRWFGARFIVSWLLSHPAI